MLGQRRWFVLRVLVGGMLAVLCWGLSATAGYAHADLRSSDPEDGAVLSSAPEAVTFTFSEEILAQGNAVTLTVVDGGQRLPVDPPRVGGDTVTVSWPDRSPAGDFRVAYRVVSADGHPIEGRITLTVEEAVGAATPVPVAAEVSPTPDEPASESPDASATASPSPASDDAPAEENGSAALLFFLGMAAAVVAGAYAGLWFMRKAR